MTQLTIASLLADVTEVPLFAAELGGDVVGLVMTPNTCRFMALRNGVLEPSSFDLSGAFELRLFCDAWEMRWVRDGLTGELCVISERADLKLSRPWAEDDQIACVGEPAKREYLLWGERDPAAKARHGSGSDWVVLTSGRTAALEVPTAEQGARYCLQAREYMASFAHGNVAVFEQRLTGIAEERSGDGK